MRKTKEEKQKGERVGQKTLRIQRNRKNGLKKKEMEDKRGELKRDESKD